MFIPLKEIERASDPQTVHRGGLHVVLEWCFTENWESCEGRLNHQSVENEIFFSSQTQTDLGFSHYFVLFLLTSSHWLFLCTIWINLKWTWNSFVESCDNFSEILQNVK